MRVSQILIVLLCSVAIGNAATNTIGGVDGVIRLCEAGMAEDLVIMAATKQQPTDLTTDQMLAVKTACKSDAVLRALMAPVVGEAAATKAPASNSSGVSLVSDGEVKQIRPVSFRRAGFKKGLGGLGSLMKMAPKMMAQLDGGQAEIRVDRQPKFILVGVDYALVRLESNGDKRQAVVGTGGLMGSRGGFEEKSLVRFSVDKTSGHVLFEKPLEPGEYAFYPTDGFEAAGEATLNLTAKAYPFGVD